MSERCVNPVSKKRPWPSRRCWPRRIIRRCNILSTKDLIEAVERQRYKVCSPIGFYFAKLWYHEELYPLIFTASALGRAVRTLYPDVRVSENCDAGRKLLKSET